jgi:hypothetical protein
MARYGDEYERPGEWGRRDRMESPAPARYASNRRRDLSPPTDYGAESRRYRASYEWGGGASYGEELREAARRGRFPHKPAHGYPVRGFHTYDLDYGSVGGPTTEYRGRPGYPVLPPRPEPEAELPPRGPYTPILEESDRERTLYGGVPPGYRGRGERRPRRRRYRRGPG